MSLIKAILLQTTLLLLSAVATIAYLNIHQRHQAEAAAYQSAKEALKRASEYVGSGVMWYAPRELDWEQAKDKMQDLDTDKQWSQRAHTLAACESSLDDYRREMDITEQAKETAERSASAGYRAGVATMQAMIKDNQAEQDTDLTELRTCLQ